MSEYVWAVESEVNGETLRVEIKYDDDPMSPRENDNLGTIIGYHGSRSVYDVRSENNDKYHSWEEWRKGELPKDCYYLPVYAYVHGDISLSTGDYNDRWDSGQIGYIYATRPKIREWFNEKLIHKRVKGQVYEALKSEVEEFSNYLNGTHYYVNFIWNGEILESSGSHLYSNDMVEDMFEIAPEKFDALKKEVKQVVYSG